MSGVVYLIHFERPISPDHTCQHYLGYTEDLTQRLIDHRAGRGARLLQIAKERGINWCLARVWKKKDRAFERQLKNEKNAPKRCPVCKHLDFSEGSGKRQRAGAPKHADPSMKISTVRTRTGQRVSDQAAKVQTNRLKTVAERGGAS